MILDFFPDQHGYIARITESDTWPGGISRRLTAVTSAPVEWTPHTPALPAPVTVVKIAEMDPQRVASTHTSPEVELI